MFKKSLLILMTLPAMFVSNAQTINSNSLVTIHQDEDDKIWTIVAKLPIYPGGEYALNKFIRSNSTYPESAKENGIQGKVVVRFVINKNGKVDRPEICKSLNPACDKEAIRIVNLIKNWTPAEVDGKKVSMYYTLPIKFQIDNGNGKATVCIEKEIVYNIQHADFAAGSNALKEIVQKSIQYPEDARKNKIEGDVVVQFIVTAQGKIESPKIVHSVSPSIDQEALRIVQNLPDFIPGTKNGVNTNTNYGLVIKFSLASSGN